MMRHRRRDQRGVVLPTQLVALSIAAVVLAAVGFVLTGQDDTSDRATPVVATPPATHATVVIPTPKPKLKPKPAIKRGEVYVEVYNNSGISGLAGQTAAKAQDAGWNVVGSDNWYGTVDASTVYYPQRLQRAAHLLGKDLGIRRLKPAMAPMRLDRLTVILTGDYR
jgi:hypothetical protein